MKQMTLAMTKGLATHLRATRKAEFLARIESLVPCAEFCALIEPHYSEVGNGQPPMGLERTSYERTQQTQECPKTSLDNCRLLEASYTFGNVMNYGTLKNDSWKAVIGKCNY